MQLLTNALPSSVIDPYYVEDDKLEELLRKTYNLQEKRNDDR